MPPLFISTAGFIAGSIPTKGKSGYVLLNSLTAALVAVLQATTNPLIPLFIKKSTTLNVKSLISFVGFIP